MLTRLRVSGFKNLVDVDVRFGPLTAIGGPNGVGKSNLVDAICFLGALADVPIADAVHSAIHVGGHDGDARWLLRRSGEAAAREMSFEAEMIVSASGLDDLGQTAQASITFLRYAVVLRPGQTDGSLELIREELSHINVGEARKHLLFPHTPAWRRSAVRGVRRVGHLISTEAGEIRVHQDAGAGVGHRSLRAASLPRTAVSAATAAECPTAAVARSEMRRWRRLQLEPSARRGPDSCRTEARLALDGAHLATTLDRIIRQGGGRDVCGVVASRLSELVPGVRRVWVERDEKREMLTVLVEKADGTSHPAWAFSGGVLRFLALAVLERDPEATGLLCLEEPENGIHPGAIPAMLEVLRDMVTDTREPLGPENPLRQVIVITHSPGVVAQMHDANLMIADCEETGGRQDGGRLVLRSLSDTWRAKADPGAVAPREKLVAYLYPGADGGRGSPRRERRVADRDDMQMRLEFDRGF